MKYGLGVAFFFLLNACSLLLPPEVPVERGIASKFDFTAGDAIRFPSSHQVETTPHIANESSQEQEVQVLHGQGRELYCEMLAVQPANTSADFSVGDEFVFTHFGRHRRVHFESKSGQKYFVRCGRKSSIKPEDPTDYYSAVRVNPELLIETLGVSYVPAPHEHHLPVRQMQIKELPSKGK